MRRLLRPSLLVIVSAILLIATIVILWPLWGQASTNPTQPLAVPAGDQEVAFLGAATNTAPSWERFVAAVRRVPIDHPEFGMHIVADKDAFPEQTTAVAEMAIGMANKPGRLWFRWYKLTGDSRTRDWVDALTRRNPPPLAIIGGNSSDRARDLALELDRQRARRADPPLFFITTATADEVSLSDGSKAELMRLYSGRTFRFCFTDRQIAQGLVDFVWRQPKLRPDVGPVYLIHWQDDPYSDDLFDRFREVMWGADGSGGVLGHTPGLRRAAQIWSWLACPPSLEAVNAATPELGPANAADLISVAIPVSIGDYNQPNLYDAGAARQIMAMQSRYPDQQRPLLVLPAAPQPARRLLHALRRIDPLVASRFLVVVGDGVDFNTVYRDRNLAWQIQDLPFMLVLFCHRNPVDPIAFQPDTRANQADVPDTGGRTSTGTQDLLLYRDIVASLARGAYRDGRLTASADELRRALHERNGGDPGFDDHGNLNSGSGEYVVVLQPVREGEEIQPRATLQVWDRKAQASTPWLEVPIAGKAALSIPYGPAQGDEEMAP